MLPECKKGQYFPPPGFSDRVECVRCGSCACHALTLHSHIGICQVFFPPRRLPRRIESMATVLLVGTNLPVTHITHTTRGAICSRSAHSGRIVGHLEFL